MNTKTYVLKYLIHFRLCMRKRINNAGKHQLRNKNKHTTKYKLVQTGFARDLKVFSGVISPELNFELKNTSSMVSRKNNPFFLN